MITTTDLGPGTEHNERLIRVISGLSEQHQCMSALPPKADINPQSPERLLCAMCGRLRVVKGVLIVDALAGRSCHVFGLLMRRLTWPLAIMLSADPGPGQKHALA